MEDLKMLVDIQNFGSKNVHLGCGAKYLDGWINVDILESLKCDIYADLNEIKFPNSSIERVYACHVLEHLKEEEALQLLKKIFAWLKDGGEIYLAVPDFFEINKRYTLHQNLAELRGLILGGGKDEYDIHKSIYDYKKLKAFLENAGFNSVLRYEWRTFDVGLQNIDDYSQAYLPHMDKDSGQLMSLNIKARK